MAYSRGRFLIGMGAFSGILLHRPLPARAQAAPWPNQADLGHQGTLYRVMLDIGEGQRLFCTAAALPRQSFAARIVEQRTQAGANSAVEDIARSSHATAAINGGRFTGGFSPDGLLIVGHKTIGRKRADWRGYLTIDDAGMASVTDAPDLARCRDAVQGDPLIVEPGGKMGIMRDDGRRFRRTVIAQSGDVILAMVTTPVSLFSLAYALLEAPGLFYMNHFDAALNLSGAATSSFYAKSADGQEAIVQSPWMNRDVIVFTPRA